jgi:hypothetical protein
MNVEIVEAIAAPQERVFTEFTKFDEVVQNLTGRVATLTRIDAPAPIGVGSEWRGQFELRGVLRDLQARMTRFDPFDGYEMEALTTGLGITLVLALERIDPGATRLTLNCALRGLSLPGRMLLQPMRLLKTSVEESAAARVASHARRIEARGA